MLASQSRERGNRNSIVTIRYSWQQGLHVDSDYDRCSAWMFVHRPTLIPNFPRLTSEDQWYSDTGVIWWSTLERTNQSSIRYLALLLTAPPSSNLTRLILYKSLNNIIFKLYSTKTGRTSFSIITSEFPIPAFQERLVFKVRRSLSLAVIPLGIRLSDNHF